MAKKLRVFCSFVLLIIAGAFCRPSSATPLTYDWQGNNGFTGSFTFDSSALFMQSVRESSLTAFSFSGNGTTFGIPNLLGFSLILFTNANPPLFYDGSGVAAINSGQELIFYLGAVEITGPSNNGNGLYSNGNFVLEVAQTPEPTTIILYGIGLLAIIALTVSRKALA